jgi:hypothetical protein
MELIERSTIFRPSNTISGSTDEIKIHKEDGDNDV